MSESSARGFVKSAAKDLATRTNATLAGLLALVGVTGIAGGFEEATPEDYVSVVAPVAAHTLAEPVSLTIHPFEMEIQRTYILEGRRVVEMQVKNIDSRAMFPSRFLGMFALENSSLTHDEQPKFVEKVFRVKNGEPVPVDEPIGWEVIANPGVPVDIALVFQDPLEAPDSGQAVEADTLAITEFRYKKSILDGTMQWLPGEGLAEVRLR